MKNKKLEKILEVTGDMGKILLKSSRDGLAAFGGTYLIGGQNKTSLVVSEAVGTWVFIGGMAGRIYKYCEEYSKISKYN